VDISVGFAASFWLSVAVAAAVKLKGAAPIIVATPLIVVATGVTVVTGFEFASRETQGSRASWVTTPEQLI